MSDQNDLPIAYVPNKARDLPSPDELRARIPGWGSDLDPADRPSVPKIRFDPDATGAHWQFPDRQRGGDRRERSIEHAFLTPVFGTAQPLGRSSGVIRRLGYRYSEGRLAHWLLLVLGDRVDVLEHRVGALIAGHPDRVVEETGVAAELGKDPIGSRLRSTRSDTHHSWIDPVLTMAPYVALGVVGLTVVSRLFGSGRQSRHPSGS